MNLKTNKFFLKTFALLFSTMLLIFCIFAVYLYSNSRKVIEEEFTTSSVIALKNMADHVDQTIKDSQYTITTLVTNQQIDNLLSPSSLDFAFNNYSKRLQEQLMTLKNSNEAIEAIYIYSEHTNQIYSYSGTALSGSHYDRYWLDQLCPDAKGISIFPYVMRNQYPYTLCIAHEFDAKGSRSVICILLNLSKLPLLKEAGNNNAQQLYIISEENEIIYRRQQKAPYEPLTVSDHLKFYDDTVDEKAGIHFNSDNTPYTLVQSESSLYPWTYVLYTPLPDYTSKLSSSRALAVSFGFAFILFSALIAVFFSLRSLKPIRSIRNFVDNPELFSYNNKDSSADIEYIAGKITQYIQTNQQLAKELSKRLNLLQETQKQALQLQINPHFLFNTLNMMHVLATDSLGYEHALPQMTLNLGQLLRYSLEPAYMVTLQTELNYNDVYLQILNQRYGENLRVIQSIDKSVLDAKVPKLFIQPIIENAVFHGFAKQHDRECCLTIQCSLQEQASAAHTFQKSVCLKISDNGRGMSAETLKRLKNLLSGKAPANGKNIGLKNVSQRLQLSYADTATIEITSIINEGSCFTIMFPYIN